MGWLLVIEKQRPKDLMWIVKFLSHKSNPSYSIIKSFKKMGSEFRVSKFGGPEMGN